MQPVDIYFIDTIDQTVGIVSEITGVTPCYRFKELLESPVKKFVKSTARYLSDDGSLAIELRPVYIKNPYQYLMVCLDIVHRSEEHQIVVICSAPGWCQIHVRCKHVLHMV